MIKYFYLLLLLISHPCFSDENKSNSKILIENRVILGSALKIVIPSVESCVTKNSCYSTGLYNIKITENNNTATIELTNTKGDGTYSLNIKKEDKGLVIKSEKLVMRDYLDDENYKLCFKYDNNKNVVDVLDYSAGELISESGMTCAKCPLNHTVKECEKNLVKTEKPKVLFDNTQYQIKCKTTACHSIRIVDKSKGTMRHLIDDINEDMFKLSTSKVDSDISFYASDDALKRGRYLRLGYTVTGYVSLGDGEEEKHVTDSCAIIDLVTAHVKEVGASMGELCYIDDYLSKVSFTPFEKISAYMASKSYLYKLPNKKTKMYLIKGDKVTILDEQTDDTGQKWYFINYKGKKDLNMWIKAEAVNIKAPQQVKPTAKPKKAEPAPQTKVETPKPAVTKTEPEPSTSKKAEATKTKSGSSSFPLLASLLGLLAWRINT